MSSVKQLDPIPEPPLHEDLFKIAGLFVMFIQADYFLRKEVSNHANRRNDSLLVLAVNLLACTAFLYYLASNENIMYSLLLVPPYVGKAGIAAVMAKITLTDFTLKLLTIILKMAVFATPDHFLQQYQKGKVFMMLERSSQFYRSLSPMRHWLYYLTGYGKGIAAVVYIAYLVNKCDEICPLMSSCKKAFKGLVRNACYGVKPTREQKEEAGGCCSICHSRFKKPVMLSCSHIFCEMCLLLWFDKNRTCPVCRTVVTDDPRWRDGSTEFFVRVI